MTDHTPITDADLDAMQQRCDAATPGPWEPKYPVRDEFDYVQMFSGTTYLGSICNTDMECDETKANAEFIAHSRTDTPRLIAEVRRLKTWHGIMSVVDKHYPVDVFTGASGDPGPTIVALMREITKLRETLERITASHRQEC